MTLDPHKWLFQQYEIGCVIVRERQLLRDTFTVFRDYMRDAVGEDDEINFRDQGVQLTRSFRALKLWMSIQVFGLAAFRDAIAHGIGLVEHAETRLEAGGWDIVTRAQLGLITFRPGAGGGEHVATVDAVTERVGGRMYDDGYGMHYSPFRRRRPLRGDYSWNKERRDQRADIPAADPRYRSGSTRTRRVTPEGGLSAIEENGASRRDERTLEPTDRRWEDTGGASGGW